MTHRKVKLYPGMFSHLERTGQDWLRKVPAEDLRIFVELGQRHHSWGRLGGKARAAQAARDRRGRFVSNANDRMGTD